MHTSNMSNGKGHSAYASSSILDTLKELETSVHGLTSDEARLRLDTYGPNMPAHQKKLGVFLQILKKFINPLIIMLLIIAGFSLFFGEKISAIFVICMILISVILDFSQEYRSDRAVEKLNALVKTKATVIRDGKEQDIDMKDVVPGDIVYLQAGDMIPADARIISCKDLFINQASLTGESFPVEKISEPITPKDKSITDLINIAFMGSSVVSGTGKAVVLKTGISTEFGAISKNIVNATNETSFDKGIRQFTMLMIKFIIVLVIAIFFIIFIFKHGAFKDAILFSLAVAVGLTPEMLPMLVTLNLSKGAIKMSEKKVIVKKLNAIQNFGAMDILCTDKTGTLTQDTIILQKHTDIDGDESDEVLTLAHLNSFYQTGLRNVLDDAILNHDHVDKTGYEKVDEIPFDFVRKVMSVVFKHGEKQVIITKGAPEEIFKRCTTYSHDNKVKKLNQKIIKQVQSQYEMLSKDGFRVLALGYKEVPKKQTYSREDENNLTLIGFISFLDPPKETAKETLDSLKELGIEIKILTGDNELVTQKICKDVGLEIKGIATGTMLDTLDDSKLRELVEQTTIFARLSPLQKDRVIKALRANKHVVGYLGDGINDAPSLKTSDVGISVNNAVDIAKESADIILIEKNLLALKDGVIEGRKVFGNITKYIKMGASSNFGNMASMSGATLFLPFLPMLPIQILLNNFLYDLSNVSLPLDDVDEEYVKKPRSWNIDFIKKFMLYIGPISSLFDFLTYAVMWFIFQGFTQSPHAIALFHTGWFIESLCSQTLVIYIIRTNKIPFIQSRPNKLLLFTTLSILTFAFILPYTPIATFFGFTPLPPLYFLILTGMMITYLTLVHFVKMWVVRKYGYQ